MHSDRMPLFPRRCDPRDCLRVPLFTERCVTGGSCASERCARDDEDPCCRVVRLYNPCKRGEYADVELCVDGCGNLSVCVHRGMGGACEKRRVPCCDRW